MKKQKGITLIALIITVIVMLILVGVTINVALNGGLFDTTKYAATETEKNAILEELISMMKWDNGSLDKEEIKNLAIAKYPNSTWDGTTGKLTIVGKQGTYEYKITDYTITLWDDKGQPGDGGETDDKGQPGEGGETKEYKFTIGDFVNNATVNETKDEDGNTTEDSYDMSIADFCNLINIDEVEKYSIHYKDTREGHENDFEVIRAEAGKGVDFSDFLLSLAMLNSGIEQTEIDKIISIPTDSTNLEFSFLLANKGITGMMSLELARGTEFSGNSYYKQNKIPENILNTTIQLKNSDSIKKFLTDNNLTD